MSTPNLTFSPFHPRLILFLLLKHLSMSESIISSVFVWVVWFFRDLNSFIEKHTVRRGCSQTYCHHESCHSMSVSIHTLQFTLLDDLDSRNMFSDRWCRCINVTVTLLFTINSSIQTKKIRIKNIVTLWNHCSVWLQEMEILNRYKHCALVSRRIWSVQCCCLTMPYVTHQVS